MHVLLIQPPENRYSIAPGRLEPLGLEVLAACIPEHDVKILDLRIDGQQELRSLIRSFVPHVIGISVNNTINVIDTWFLLKQIRSTYPKGIIAVGGHHPTMIPEDFHLPEVDFIFLGWAEKSFPAFLKCLDDGCDYSKIDGLEVLKHGKVLLRNENPFNLRHSDIPFPRRDLIKKYLKNYRSDSFMPTGLVNSTRGCANRCTFCSVWQSSGGRVVVRPPEDVFHEIANLPDNISHVFFADDNSFIKPENQRKLGELISSHGIRKKYSGYCRSDTIIKHPELMAQWKEIGLDNLCVGFEGTDDSDLIKLNKGNIVGRNEEAARILNKLGISFRPHFLIDPSFEKSDFERIHKYVHRLRLDSPIFPILTPIPGTQQYNEVRHRIILNYQYFDYAHAVVPTALPVREFYKTWISLYLSCYSFKFQLKHFFIRQFGLITGNQKLAEDHHHMNLRKLFMLKLISVILRRKLRKHCTMLEKTDKQQNNQHHSSQLKELNSFAQGQMNIQRISHHH
jgi:hopanoid C-3 methylase